MMAGHSVETKVVNSAALKAETMAGHWVAPRVAKMAESLVGKKAGHSVGYWAA